MLNKMVTVVTCCDSGPLAEEALGYLKENSTPTINEIILLDNGSFTPLLKYSADTLIRYEENIGGNAVFHRVIPLLEERKADVVAFFHTDFMIREKGWDEMVLFAFDLYPKLGLMGFLGSDEIDYAGGRGLGTRSSYMGYEYKTIWASPAEIHGARSRGLQPAAVIDHMSMIFRVSVLKEIPSAEEIHTPGHFYDRVACLEVLNRGHHIATYGIECDHTGGGIGLAKARISADPEPGVLNRDKLYTKWLTERNIPFEPELIDSYMYKEGEKRYLGKWRDQLSFIPLKVKSDYSIVHTHPQWGK